MKLRLIEAGTVSYVRSQTLYHALGYTRTGSTNTIVVSQPDSPYMCIGYFQDACQELNLEYCKQNHLPVLRRETGGGTVYIDNGQVFVQWILTPGFLPRRTEDRFQIFVKPIIETYKFFGIDAYYHPINDVHVGGRKIVGTGAGTIGDSEVVTGNFLFHFNYETMLEALKVPDLVFKSKVQNDLKKYMTTIEEELSVVPEIDELTKVYLKKCSTVLGLDFIPGELTNKELMKMEELDKKFLSEKWLFKNTNPDTKERLVKIHNGIWVGQAVHETPSGKIKTTLSIKDDSIEDIEFDIELKNGEERMDISGLREIIGTKLTITDISHALLKISDRCRIFSNADWVESIMKIKRMQQKATGNAEMERQGYS